MQVFDRPTHEDAFWDWLVANPEGFVVNCQLPNPKPSYLKLHSSACRSISRGYPGQERFTGGAFQKVCSDDRSELEAWARRFGGELDPCPICKP